MSLLLRISKNLADFKRFLGLSMDSNKEEACRAKALAEDKMKSGDFVEAQKLLLKAQSLFSGLESLPQMLAVCDVHCSADKKINGLENWYGILQVMHFADDATIKKQVRKLSLLLHPDKNQFAGAEAAFKLVWEASRLLADKDKRSQYDIKRRIYLRFARSQSNGNSGVQCAAENNASDSFRRSYMAFNTGFNGAPPKSSTGQKEVRNQGTCDTSVNTNVESTGAQPGSVAADVEKKGTFDKKNGGGGSKKTEVKKPKIEAESSKPKKDEAKMKSAAKLHKRQPEVTEPEIGASKSVPDEPVSRSDEAASMSKDKKKRKKCVEEPIESVNVDGSGTVEDKADSKDNNKRKSPRISKQSSYTVEVGNNGSLSPPKKRSRSNVGLKSKQTTRKGSLGVGSSKRLDSGGSSAPSCVFKGKAKKNVDFGYRETPSTKDKESEGCEASGERVVMAGKIDNNHNANEKLVSQDLPDPEFNNFELKTSCFAVNQVWSMYDPIDGMPRLYARIAKVLASEFKLWITWIDPVQDIEDNSIPIACGIFQDGNSEEENDHLKFSCQMLHSTRNNNIVIYPRKGEIWATFRGWDINWSASSENHKRPYEYDFVEILSNFKDQYGLGVAYLGKVKGFVSLFRQDAQDGVLQLQIPPSEMLRFSHKVPSFKMTGKEREGVPPGCFELDTAALPKDMFEVDVVELDKERPNVKNGGRFAEVLKVEVQASTTLETSPSPKKRQKVDDNHVLYCGQPAECCTSGEKRITPKKNDKINRTDSSRIRKIPVDIHRSTGYSKKFGRNDESLSQSRGNGFLTRLNGVVKCSETKTHVPSSCKTVKENTFNFEKQRSLDKFQIDQVWAIYSNDKGIPRKYVQIKEIDTSPEFKLYVAPLETEGEVKSKGKQLEQMNIDLERYRVEVIAEKELLGRTENGRRELEEEIERKRKDLSLVVDKIAECEKLFETRSSELLKTQGEVKLKGKQLEEMNIDLERHRGEVRAEMVHLGRSRIWNSELEEEIERKRKDLTVVLDEIADNGKQLESVKEKLDSQQKLLETRSSELVSKKRELDGVNLDLDLREQAVNSLDNEMESKAKELKEIERLIKEKKAHSESIKLLLEEHTEELASKEKRQNEITEAIRKLSLEIVVKDKTLERAKDFIQKISEKQRSKQEKMEATERRLERYTKDYDSKKKELRTVKDTLTECVKELKIKEREFDSLQSLITERNQQVEEGEKKKQHLDNTNEELTRQFQVKQEEVCSINKAIRECSDDLKSKSKHLDQVQSSISNLTAELKSKECDLKSIKKKIQDRLKDFQSKEEQQVILKASLIEREQELGLKEKQFDARSKKIELKEKELGAREEKIDKKDQLLKSTEQQLVKCVTDYELKAKKLASFCQQSNSDQNVDLVRDACVSDEKTLQLLLRGHVMKCHQLHLDVSCALKASSDPTKLVLDTIQGLHRRMEVTKLDPHSVRRSSICLLECLMDISPEPKTEVQGEAIKIATEWKNTTLVKAENPVEVLGFLHFLAAFSLAYTFDAAKVQDLFDFFLRKYAPSLCEALGVSSLAPVNNVLSLDDKPEQQPPEAPISNNSDSHSPDVQENIATSHLANEDAILEPEGSSSFSPNEVFTGLKVMEDPGRYVLNTVKDALMDAQQRRELGLAEPMVKNLIALLEELPRVVKPSKNLLLDALQVANQWSLLMGTSAQMSPLEAWGFLQLIVAYGLVHRTDRDSTLRFAWHVAHFKQAPKLFDSLGLGFAIPDLVRQLLSQRLHILAIRFIISFNLNYNVSPLDFLKEEIIILRRAAKEKRRFDSQAEDRDAAKLRDIIELIEDFKLEIDLPAELILKFMVPRETQNQNQYVVSTCVPIQPLQVHVQASHTVIHSSYIATHSAANPTFPTSVGASQNQQVLDLETYQAGGSTALQAQSSRQAGFKRPRIDTSASRAVIRPCFNPSSSGRF